jgi:alkylation response protein AidB-like acyl-CoA dehydrogenase
MDLLLNKKQSDMVCLAKELGKEINSYSIGMTYSSDAQFDWSLIRKLGQHNFVCPIIPEEYGGLGLDYFTTALVLEEIATAYPSLATVINCNIHSVVPLLLAGSPQQKEHFLPALTGNDAGLAAFALVETTDGFDVSGLMTCASKTSGGYVINGHKEYVLNAPVANFTLLFAFTDYTDKSNSMRAFIIPKGNPGFHIGPRYFTSALNYTQASSIIFDNVDIANDLIIREQEICSGYLLMRQTLDIGRAMVAATAVGIARAAYELAQEFTNERLEAGASKIENQVIAHSLVDMATKIELARLMTWKACWLMDQGGDFTIPSAMAKITACTFAQEITRMAADIVAAHAYGKGMLIEQLVRDARALSAIEGGNNNQRNLISSLL